MVLVAAELVATLVLRMTVEDYSIKISQEWPDDPPADVQGPDWAGVLPARTRYTDAWPAPDPRICVRHHRGRLLVTDVDHLQARLLAGVLAVDHRAAHEEEDGVDAVLRQAAGDYLVPGHPGH